MNDFTFNAKVGQYATLTLTCALAFDFLLFALGVTTPWLLIPIGFIELFSVPVIAWAFFSTMTDFFNMSLIGLKKGTIMLDQQGAA